MTDDDDPGDATTLDTDAPSPATGFRVQAAASPRSGRYQRGAEIARGGLGTVTSALDRTLQRQVAIKELHTRTEQGRQRFVREALTTARLQHPAIVPIFDVGTSDGDPYLVLKLLEGKTLAEQLATTTSTADRLALLPNLLAVADALGYAHEQQVVHRDVKPANIMTGSHGETVLLDWGIAHDNAAVDGVDGDGIAGTPRYMSPEQARGEPASPRFDVYSLGLTMAAVLGAEIPFAGLAPGDILARLRESGRPRVELATEVPADLASIVDKALAPAAERYADAGGLADDVRKFIAGQLVSSRSYTARQLVGRWLRRNRVLVAIAGVAVVVVVTTAIVAITSVVRERNVAVVEREQAVAREHELVLLHARAALRTDPTAAIAWLKQYPADAPHQDELVALVDEAEGRGVARHVWRAADEPADAGFADDGTLISANRDGEVLRADPATGSLRRLAKLAVPAVFARVYGRDAVVLDRDGGVHRISDAGASTVATIAMRAKPSGVFVMPSAELKITFVGSEATWIPEPPHKPSLGEVVFADDEIRAAVAFGVTADGRVMVAEPEPRELRRFAPRTWVRGSDDGKRYLAIEPGADQTATVWLGTTDGAPPIVLGSQRACATGEYRAQQAELDVAGRIAVVYRCGVLAIYDVAARQPIPIADPDRVRYFVLSPDARWLAIGRSDGLDVIELATGASRRFAGGSGVSTAGFAPHGDALYSAGAEHGLRVWSLHDVQTIGRLGDVATPTSLALSTRAGELTIGQNLDCAVWSVALRRVVARSDMAMASARQPDDVDSLWPWQVSGDGRACVFAGLQGVAIVASAAGPVPLFAEASVDDCVLSDDGAEAWCRTSDDKLVMFDIARSAVRGARDAGGKVRGLARYRGGSVAVIERGGACQVETVDGAPIARLAPECRSVRASNAAQPGRETGLVVTRAHATEVWTERGSISVAGDPGRMEVSRGGLVAVAREREVEVWDIATHARRAGPIDHPTDVLLVAWSPSGILASSDDDIIQLWDPEAGRTRTIYAPHTNTMVWSADGHTLFTSDGKVIEAWPIDLATAVSPVALRARLDALTSARIVDGRVTTP